MRRIILYLLLMTGAFSCTKFLQEEPTGFIETSNYYQTASQVKAAVAGTYTGLGRLFNTRIGISVIPALAVEYMSGYASRPYSPNSDDIQFLHLVKIDPANQHISDWWNATYFPLENCNSVIANLQVSTVIDEDTKRRYLGEVYFLRAWYYFQGVRVFGDMPLKTTPTLDLENILIKKSPADSIYSQIITDLLLAEQCGLPWTDKSGHVSLGAVKALLSKVYLTMAGYPLRKGHSYYRKAFEKSREVIVSGQFSLFSKYAELKQPSKQNTGEHIFSLQRDPVNAPNPLHFALMPFPYLPVSIKPTVGGALAPVREFYQSYQDNDMRKQEQQFFYTSFPEYNRATQQINFPSPCIFKYWDSTAEVSNKAGLNIDLIRYADILLVAAEAKAGLDGGTTTDASAIDAFYQVRHRAFPQEQRPAIITTDQVLKERYWELCFEFQSWYDMLRTRRLIDLQTNQMVGLIGYKSPGHLASFREEGLLFPIPLQETLKNPNLK